MVQVLACSFKIASVDRILYHFNRCNVSSTIWNPSEAKILEQIKATQFVSEYLAGYKVQTLVGRAQIPSQIAYAQY